GRYSSPFVQLKSVTATGPLTASAAFAITSFFAVVPQGESTVTVEDLPGGLAVKSITYGTDDLKTGTLKVTNTLTKVTTLAVALTTAPRTDAGEKGVRVLGSMKDVKSRSIYMDGISGVIYSDGTFEFRGVQPGRHAIVTPDHPARAHPFAASIVVGDRNIDGIQLEEAAVLPPD